MMDRILYNMLRFAAFYSAIVAGVYAAKGFVAGAVVEAVTVLGLTGCAAWIRPKEVSHSRDR